MFSSDQSAEAPRAITTTDLLKIVGVAAFLLDHYGFYFQGGELWWRVLGRTASPIFFFLLGFARSRDVPWTWLVFGAALTASQTGVIGGFNLNILLNFAILRFAVLPLLERFVMPRMELIAPVTLACLLLIGPSNLYLGYGTQGWLWAIFGLAQRLRLEGRQPAFVVYAQGAVAAAVYLRNEASEFGFTPVQIGVFVAIVVPLTLILAEFRRAELPWQPGKLVERIVELCGRHSLEIYAFTLFGMQAVFYAMRP